MGGVGAGAQYERFPGAAALPLPVAYARRQPELSVLHRVVREHLPAFLERTSEEGRGIPAHARREIERYLECGMLANGFARVRCPGCGFERLVAHSCKGRGLCPSCGARRMSETAAELVDHVLPVAPYRQWVLTVPHRIRYLLARQPELVTAILACFLRLVQGHLRRKARSQGVRGGQLASVTWVQRFGDSLNGHVHFHAVIADGVFVEQEGAARFHAVPAPADEEVQALCAKAARRMTRLLKRRGLLGSAEPAPEDADVMARLVARSVLANLAYQQHGGEIRPPRRRCASVEGFSVHANVHLHPHDRPGLEHLCRYAGRNSLALSRLSQDDEGRVHYRFKHPMANGATELVLEPMDFLARLVALIPPPRAHLTRYHGALAPNAKLRPKVVLVPKPKAPRRTKALRPSASEPPVPEGCRASPAPTPAPPASEAPPSEPVGAAIAPAAPVGRLDWASLLKRVFAIDVLQCPKCPGRMEVLAHLTDPKVVKQILEHLGLPTTAPPRGVAATGAMIEDVRLTDPAGLSVETEAMVEPAYEEPYIDAATGRWSLEILPARGAPMGALNSPSRAQPGGRMVAQAEGEAEEGGGEGWRRGAERAQGPPRNEGTETGSEPVAELEERGEG